MPPVGLSNWCKRLAARIARPHSSRPIQTLLASSKLGGEPEPNDRECSRQLLPPSGPARMEGLSPVPGCIFRAFAKLEGARQHSPRLFAYPQLVAIKQLVAIGVGDIGKCSWRLTRPSFLRACHTSGAADSIAAEHNLLL